MSTVWQPETLVTALKSAAEPTRLRILLLLADGELSVKDLTQILGQSQPRISRHLKLLTEAGLVERFREGSWVFFYLSDQNAGGRLAKTLLASVDASDATVSRDRERASALKREREATAQSFFEAHAGDWDRIRALHVDEAVVEDAIRDSLGPGPFKTLVDLGTGTGRILELLGDRYQTGLGIDANQAMLGYARAKLSSLGLSHAQVRHGDIYNLALPDRSADAVVMHQVLHFLVDPARAIEEAARVLVPGGQLLIVDFAPHDLEFLRDTDLHERLGFSGHQVSDWMEAAGLLPLGVSDLAPSAAAQSQKLTVSVWLGKLPEGVNADAAAQASSDQRKTRERSAAQRLLEEI